MKLVEKEIQKNINTIRKLPLSQLKILTFLSFRGPSSPKEINEEIDVPYGTIRPSLRHLRSKGYLTQELNGTYKSNICFTDIIISKIIYTREKEFKSHVLASVSKIIYTREKEFKSHVLASVSKIIYTREKEFKSRVLASVSKIIKTRKKPSAHAKKFKSRVPAPYPIIISVPEPLRIAVKTLKDAGYPPNEIKRIMKAKGKNVPTNVLKELLEEPVLPRAPMQS